jgi:hypothetical protein
VSPQAAATLPRAGPAESLLFASPAPCPAQSARRRVRRRCRDRHPAPAPLASSALARDAIRLLDALRPPRWAALARYTLVALHDAQSTRSLHGMNFKKLVMDAELGSGDAQLAVLPLALYGDHWVPAPAETGGDAAAASPGMRPVPLELLEDDGSMPRLSRAFSVT